MKLNLKMIRKKIDQTFPISEVFSNKFFQFYELEKAISKLIKENLL